MPASVESRRLLLRVYGDSLSLPRCGDGISFADTFPERFCEALRLADPELRVHLYNRSRSAGTAPVLAADYATDCRYFGPQPAQVIVIQCGICDCAPRPLPPRLRSVVGRLPSMVRSPIIAFLHRNRARLLNMGLTWKETGEDTFRDTLGRWLASAAREARLVLVINIAPTMPNTEAHSPGLGASIALYNAMIAEAVKATDANNVLLIDAYAGIRETPGGVAAHVNAQDGHHINVAAHEMYARLLLLAVASVLTSSITGVPSEA